ncbi:MAG: hypothetical protein LQ343_001659 [Gyalolechia ehrenbergii]|nr:MAG: hypothetical protein LQ343_001659 [Gyalolechia ehrenbergii]
MSDGVISCQTKSDLNLSHETKEATPNPPPTSSRPGPNFLTQDGTVADMGKPKRTPRKNQGTRQNGSPSMPKLNSTPQPNHRTNSFTPGKKINTPSPAYAGPTFHASPAASSLPMPRFFSKSVPEVNKDPSVQSATEKEITETSSEQSEGSPTPTYARRNIEEPVREESPLDIFFKADKEQKERQRKVKETYIGTQNPISPAVELDQPRRYSRHSTNGPMEALFPVELEHLEPAQTSHEKAISDPTSGARDADNSGSQSTTHVMETPQQAEQRKAKTTALKKLLMSSMPTKPDSSPSIEPVDASTPDEPRSQREKRVSASQIHKQIAAHTAQQLSPRPRPSSNLRKEMSASALPDGGQMSELPATPTPSRTRNAYKSVPLEGRMGSSLNAASSPSTAPNPSKRSTLIPEAAGHSSPYKTMEDGLRRILKLNVLPSDGATGVDS